jgi:hypothetical protein
MIFPHAEALICFSLVIVHFSLQDFRFDQPHGTMRA